ncbi:MAG: putative bifunctional diguanylate cyclase/phosphodiesterase [Spirochaetota bacterium]
MSSPTMQPHDEARDFEPEYRNHERLRSRPRARVALVAGIAFYTVSAGIDLALFPSIAGTLLIIRFAGFGPAALAALLFARRSAPVAGQMVSTTLLIAIAGLSLAAIAAVAPSPGNASYYAGIVVVFLYAYTFARLPLRWSAVASWSIVAGYNVIMALAGQMSVGTGLANNFVFLAANVAGMAGAAAMERASRSDFARGRVLERQRGELERLNAELEGRVDVHTREASRASEALAFLANHDHLTGLKNRRAVQARMNELVESQTPFAVVLIDVDRFKSINDSLGHRQADELLRQLGQRLRDRLRDNDTVGRQGGDEYTVLLADAANDELTASIVERLLETVRRPLSLGGQTITVTATLGVALYPRDASNEEALVRCADSALYEAKRAGRNQIRFFSAVLGETTSQRARTERLLRSAIERHELFMNYQPKIDLATGALCGVEALLRWRSVDGMVSPALFIPISEEIGLMSEIGPWVLHTAISEMLPICSDLDEDFLVSVNLSATQFADDGLLDLIAGAIDASGMPARRLRFEIVESSLMQNVELASRVMTGIRELGASISIDDFGTGYSSLAYLSRFPIDELKIDRAFVSSFGENEEDETIVRSIVLLGHSLGLSVVAEGVETPVHEEMLRGMGCDVGQGYYYSRPVAAADLSLEFRDGKAFLPRPEDVIE